MSLRVRYFFYRLKINFFKTLYINKYSRFLASVNSKEELYIFDLDNTLADTYPYFKQEDKYKMYKTLPAHQNMLKIARDIFNSDIPAIILTARDYRFKYVTKYWLDKYIPQKKVPLFIVPTAKDKINYLSMALNKVESITYYDDLSYNHENGIVKFYNDEIKVVKQMPITYYGYDAINQINSD
jgi:hypothetical protein